MTFQQFLLILRARWGVVLATFLSVLAIATAAAFLLPKKYEATTTLVVDFKGTDPVLGLMLPSQMLPGYLATQVEILGSHRVAVEAVRRLRLAENPTARQLWREDTGGRGEIEDWLAQRLLRDFNAQPSRDSSLIEVSYTARDPHFAAQVSNAFAEAYQTVNLALRVDPARATAQWFDEQLGALRANLESKQAALNAYQREKGIHSSDERLDMETSKLNELTVAYTSAQSNAFDLTSRQRQLRDFLDRGADPATLPDVLGNPLVQQLKAVLAQTEARLQQVSSQLGANHPDVQRLRAEAATQRERLLVEVRNVSASIDNSASLARKREAELRAAMEAQKSRLLGANAGRDQISVLVREVEAAQRAYDAAAARFTQTNLESQSTVTNVAVLNRAVAPLQHDSPKRLLIMIVATALGAFLGVLVALMFEMFDRRVRSSADLLSYLDFPLLGELERAVASRSRRIHLPFRKRQVLPAPG